METSALTFVALDEHIDALPEHPSYQIKPKRRVKWGYVLAATTGTLALVLAKVLPPKWWVVILLYTLLAIEIIGLILAISGDFDSFKLTPARQRREFAEMLDFDMPNHEELIEWLRAFPHGRLEAMSDFVELRIERFRSKLPLLTGSMDKLGALPVLVALVIQFKGMRWPPSLNWLEIVFFGVLMFLYWLCMLSVSQRLRLELYGALLKKALATPN